MTRSAIIRLLDRNTWRTTSEITGQVPVSFGTVSYHLKNMERESIVERDPEGQGWKLGPIQQSSLEDFLKPARRRRKRR
ncbi:MAG: winged helix-turn-helix transcriptional regulator [Candidatus Thorarchaeota archaeon]|nr:MAG: winged helix-turn-helix transcriptional regulator [Candidatus Thorarchaeota archaeon]